MTVGVDRGDQWSDYCILGLGGETLAEGQFRKRRLEVGEFFHGLAMSRGVFEVGTHSAWVREVIAGLVHEVLCPYSAAIASHKSVVKVAILHWRGRWFPINRNRTGSDRLGILF